MDISKTITQINNIFLKNAIESPRPLDELRLELSSKITQLKAMRTIVSMIQQSKDTSTLLGDVLKIIDTDSYELKLLCNIYLKYVCVHRPGCLLMCTHTFFKDFNDRNFKIQKLAVIDSVELSDEILIRNYVRDIKRMCVHPEEVVRMVAARSISLIYTIKNKALFYEENLLGNLKNLLNDKSTNVRISTIRAISVVEYHEDVISIKDLVKIGEEFWESGDQNGLRSVLNALKYKKLDEFGADFLKRTLKSSDVAVFYLSALKLMQIGYSEQLIYNEALGFMDMRPEQLFNLLLFLMTFIDRIVIDPLEFFISSSDPDFIRVLKLKILIKKYDELDSGIRKYITDMIRRERSSKVFLDVLEYSIKNGTIPGDFFQKNEHSNEIIKIIHRNFDECMKCKPIVMEFLDRVRGTKEPKLFLYLASEFCDRIPKMAFKLENESNTHALIRFYVKMMHRGIITYSQCENYLKNLQKSLPFVHRIRIVLANLENLNPDDICAQETRCVVNESEAMVDFKLETPPRKLITRQTVTANSLYDQRHYNPQAIALERDMERSFAVDKYTEIGDLNDTHQKIESFPMLIDKPFLKGYFYIEKQRLVLAIDILERGVTVKYDVGGIEHEERVVCEGKYSLFEITEDMHSLDYRVEIETQIFTGTLK